MTAEEQIAEAIRILEDSLATDFLTDSVRDIMTRAVAMLKSAQGGKRTSFRRGKPPLRQPARYRLSQRRSRKSVKVLARLQQSARSP